MRLADGKPATAAVMRAIKTLLRRGYILLPEGEHGNIISFTPPLTITQAQLAKAVKVLAEVLATDGHGVKPRGGHAAIRG
jgi:4-aminobutyrate aminotransferase-like enzyme